MANDKASKFFRIILVILFFSIILLLVFKLAGRLVLDSQMGINAKPPTSNPYEQYKATVKRSADGETYYFKLENLNGSMSAPDGSGNTYYSMDIVLETKNQRDAVAFQQKADQVANAIRDTTGSFRRQDTVNEKGREYLKLRIKNRVEEITGSNDIDAVYFEKLVYQEADY